MPPVFEIPQRESSSVWADDCMVERTSGWQRQAVEGSWIRPRRTRARATGAMHRSPTEVALEVRFENLADEWEQETAFESVVTRKALHPAYQSIIGMGNAAVPLILRRLCRAPHQWFWALTAITDYDPAQGEESAEAAAEAWLDWGRARGLIVD